MSWLFNRKFLILFFILKFLLFHSVQKIFSYAMKQKFQVLKCVTLNLIKYRIIIKFNCRKTQKFLSWNILKDLRKIFLWKTYNKVIRFGHETNIPTKQLGIMNNLKRNKKKEKKSSQLIKKIHKESCFQPTYTYNNIQSRSK